MSNNNDEGIGSILAKKAAEKGKKKVVKSVKKAAKKVAKAAVKALIKIGAMLVKTLLGFLITTVGPVLLGILGIILLIIVIYAASSMFLSFGDDSELDTESKEFRAKVELAVQGSIDYSNPAERPYMLPPELIYASVQMLSSERTDLSDDELIALLVDNLKPQIEYEEIEHKTEMYTMTCVDGSCSNSPTTTETWKVKAISSVIAWNGTLTVRFDVQTLAWEHTPISSITTQITDSKGKVTGSTTTSTQHFARSIVTVPSEVWDEDYYYFAKVMQSEPFNYTTEDIIMIEQIFNLSGGEMNYSDQISLQTDKFGTYYFDDGMTIIPGAGVPAEYMQYYMAGQKAYGVEWSYIAAIHYVETKFSTHKPMISSAGAEGHSQFMVCTWLGWNYPGCKGSKGNVVVAESIKYSPSSIANYGGYGVDADGDGIASTFSLADALMTTAKYLSNNGFSKDVAKSIRAYNHSDKYVNDVMTKAKEFKAAATYETIAGPTSSLGFGIPTFGRITSTWGERNLVGSDSFHAALDIGNSMGTPIYSIGVGTVSKINTGCPINNNKTGSTCGGGWGNYIRASYVVDGKIYEAIYAHLSHVNVRVGQLLTKGQIIGAMGSSGSSTGSHLHIEMHIPNRPSGSKKNVINPLYYLPSIPTSKPM